MGRFVGIDFPSNPRLQTSKINKVEYTDISRLHGLRLEDSFRPGALQKSNIVIFQSSSQFHSHTRDGSHTLITSSIPATM